MPEIVDKVLAAMLAMQRYSWEQGVAAHAVHDLGRFDLLLVMAHDAVTRQSETGEVAFVGEESSVNCGSAGEAVAWAAERTGEARYATARDRLADWFLHHAPRDGTGTLYHLRSGMIVMADSVYMISPFLARAGHPDAAVAQLRGHRSRLFDPTAGLYRAIWDDVAGRMQRPDFWGTGNGWVVAAIARMMPYLKDRADRAGLADHARCVVDACLRLRRSDGLFHDVVGDPCTYVETNLAQMLAYTVLTGVADGWLPDRYRDVGLSLRQAAACQVDELGVVRGVAGSPHFDHPGTSVEGQAFFLLAHAAAARVA